MTNNELSQLTSRVVGLLENPGYQNDLAQVRAKALLQEIGEPSSPPRWTYVGSRFVRNSAAAAYGLATIAITDPRTIGPYQEHARRLALAWENLAKLSEGVPKPNALLNAALAFEFAGYQANAACLAGQVTSMTHGLADFFLERLISIFLQRRLINAWRLGEDFLNEPPSNSAPLPILAVFVAMAPIADAVRQAARYFLSGSQDAYERALSLLEEATRVLDKLSMPNSSNLAYGLRATLPLMQLKSTWAQLDRLVGDSEIWRRYRTLLARGPGGLDS